MAGIRGVTLSSLGGVVGPTRRNTDERRFPPDDPNAMLVSTVHWSIKGWGVFIGFRRFFIRY